MKPKFLIFAVLLGALPVATAAADPFDGYKQRMEKRDKGHERGEYKYEERRGRHGEYKYEEKGPGYKIERKRDRNGEYSYEYKGNRPPPWAPAHGWRRKHDRGDYRPRDGAYEDTAYLPPLDIGAGRCNREVMGAVLGGAAGAVVGSHIGKGTGRLVATATGPCCPLLLEKCQAKSSSLSSSSPKKNACALPARQACSHCASVGRRAPAAGNAFANSRQSPHRRPVMAESDQSSAFALPKSAR